VGTFHLMLFHVIHGKGCILSSTKTMFHGGVNKFNICFMYYSHLASHTFATFKPTEARNVTGIYYSHYLSVCCCFTSV